MFTRTAVLAVAATGLIALTGCDKAETAAAPAPAATTATAARTATATTTTVAAAATKPATERAKPATERAKPAGGCPVATATLQKLADYPAGWRIDESSVKCKDDWAVASMIAPSPDQQGDGRIFFAYDRKTGKWAKKGEGSAVECGAGDAMNIPPSTGFCG
ncbi:hypothetical protein [Actinoplanes siamensis]|uniref:Lipoprotein n=1 Tax=Actinoplanes siamensis TaxID=1223317 RepID=A0A919N6L3_9ACTN|nr:hypothetical protein [Actinoplanes siamensis]GIF05413.1 hypothetical protein Asi03nite_29510 [Actinoplanes siamensis]